LGFWNYNSVTQALLASNILCLFISTEVTGGTELHHTHSSLIQHLNNVIFWALSEAIFNSYNVHNLEITRITTFRIRNVVYQAGSRWDHKCVFNLLRFFERTLYKSNYIIFILSWCRTHTKIMSKLVDIFMAGSQKITLCCPQRTPLGILRVKQQTGYYTAKGKCSLTERTTFLCTHTSTSGGRQSVSPRLILQFMTAKSRMGTLYWQIRSPVQNILTYNGYVNTFQQHDLVRRCLNGSFRLSSFNSTMF